MNRQNDKSFQCKCGDWCHIDSQYLQEKRLCVSCAGKIHKKIQNTTYNWTELDKSLIRDDWK